MADGPRKSKLDDRRISDAIDEVLGRANPNPTRDGCLSPDTLLALARRTLPIEDPGYVHLANCSECYRAFRALQDSDDPPGS
jgi:hypothetical protein